jgi:lipoprotein-releasing system permease protein
MMTLVMFVVMLIAAFLIYATLNMMVTQKVKDVGILSALGGAPAAVGAIFTRCGFVIGALGGAAGMAAGTLSAIYLDTFDKWMHDTFGFELFPREMFDLPHIPYQLEPALIVQVALAALGLSLLVAWLPARKAARMHPVQALAYE